MPRIAGLIFNPVSFYYAFEPDGETLAGVLAEVTNTPWGERHTYLAGDDLRKELHVSPLMPHGPALPLPRAGTRPDAVGAHREHRSDDGGKAFDATLNLRRQPFTVAPLLRGSALRTLPLIYVPRTGAAPARRPRPPPSRVMIARHHRPRPAPPHPRRHAVVTENGRSKRFGNGEAPHAHVTVNDPRAWPLLLKGSSGMGEAYAAGTGTART